jgi:hypothetical protein
MGQSEAAQSIVLHSAQHLHATLRSATDGWPMVKIRVYRADWTDRERRRPSYLPALLRPVAW